MSHIDRRQWLRAASMGVLGTGASGLLPTLAQAVATDSKPTKRRCIVLWMSGGPSQMDTFDMKPGHENGGTFKEVSTKAPGLKFSEHLPKLAEHAKRLAVVRSLSTKEGDHGRGTYLVRTGHQPAGPIRYPAIGSSLSKELDVAESDVPAYVSISPYRVFNQAAFSPGFLGPAHAPMTVGATNGFQQQQAQNNDTYAELKVDDLMPPDAIDAQHRKGRLDLWQALQSGYLAKHAGGSGKSHDTTYQRAVRLMESEAVRAFDLEQESAKVRDAYGRGRFGQGCLMARRLLEEGVPLVEVSLGGLGGGALGWDTHRNNFDSVKRLSGELDAGWGTLMTELEERGLLDSTTIVWLGEFGRTPKINRGGGRDHYPKAWSCVLAGGGIQGGQAYGSTSADGTTVEENQVEIGQVLATLAAAVGVSPEKQNMSGVGRPIRIAEGQPIKEILG